MLDLRQFTVLRAVARTGSLAAAARELHLSQPTVAHHLGALESHLQVQVLERTPRGTVLTELGEVLLGHVEAVLDRLDVAVTEVRSLAQHGVLTLRVGTFPTAGAQVLPGAVAQLRKRCGVRVELVEAEPPALLVGLASRELHAAIVYLDAQRPPVLPPQLASVRLFDDPYLLVLPSDHPAAHLERVPIGLLAEDGWILSHDLEDPGDLALIAAAAAAGYRPRPVLRTDDYDVVFGFVAAGLGVALVPEMAAVPRAGAVVRPIAGFSASRTVRFLAPGKGSPPAVALLLEALREQSRGRVPLRSAQ
jgi:molybdate transport repressor ModE-like protein